MIHKESEWGLFFMSILILVLVLWCGPLLPVWMFLNSLQLIVHLPMVRSRIPSAANLLFLDYLTVIRLHLGGFHETLADLLGLSKGDAEDYRLIGEDGYYNELFHQCGYHASFLHNLVIIFFLAVVFALLWFFLACKDNVCFASSNHERWWNNFLIRFLYEVFFELCLCLMLSFAALDFRDGRDQSVVSWGLSIVLTLLVACSMCYLGLLCVRGGPYVEGSYEKKSLRKSFWQHRLLSGDILATMTPAQDSYNGEQKTN